MLRICCFGLMVLLADFAVAQLRVVGVIRDSSSGKPLPFATVAVQGTKNKGVAASLNGEFSIVVGRPRDFLVFSYMGFESKVLPVDGNSTGRLVVSLRPLAYKLGEVTVYPTENPAHRIINNVVAHVKENDPDQIPAYQCRLYSKTVFRFEPHKNSKNEALFKGFADTMGVFITESVVDRSYAYKDITKEVVVANRVSGLQNPIFSINTSDFQPIHFYQPAISLLDKKFLNPISPNSTKSYFFQLKDTIVNDADTTFIIQFSPRRGTNFDGLKGFLHIATNRWAIKNVVAERADKSGIDIRIEQEYAFQRGRWFPKSYKHQMILPNYPPGFGLSSYLEGVGTIYDLTVSSKPSPGLAKSTVEIADSASWSYGYIERYRAQPLSKKDSTTYRVIDRIGRKYDMDRFQFLMEELLQARVPVRWVSIPLTSLYSSNSFEKNRFGLGLETNARLSRFYAVGAFFAYGSGDKGWKYGGSFRYMPFGNTKTSFRLSYRRDLDMATHFYLVGKRRNVLVDRFLLDRADRVEEYAVAAQHRAGDFDLLLEAKRLSIAPTYSYFFRNINQLGVSTVVSEISSVVRFGYKEKEMRYFNTYLYQSQGYPVFGLKLRQGFKVAGGDYPYTSVEAGLFKEFSLRKAGVLKVTASLGCLFGDVPYSLLYGTNGTNSSYFPFLVNSSFNCAKPFEYASSRYSTLFAYYDLGSLLYSSKYFKPTISLFQACGWSYLKNSGWYDGLNLKDMQKGYFESGLILGSLARFKVFEFLYFGIGAGAFVAYGDAVKLPLEKTLTYKLDIRVDY